MARHASPSKPHARRVLIALATVSAALGASAATASADSTAAVKVPLSPATAANAIGKLDPQKSLQGPTGQVRSVTGSRWTVARYVSSCAGGRCARSALPIAEE